MANVRDDKNPGIFAENAQTSIPVPPTPGTPYRDPVNGLDDIANGWRYEQRVLSQEFNEILFRLTTLTELIDRTGVLGWSDKVNYDQGYALVFGSNNLLYKALQDSGPDFGGGKDPTANPTYWKQVVDIPPHNELQSIQGGVANERYHISLAELQKLQGLTKDHNALDNLQGGSSAERNHLSNAQVQKLDDIQDASFTTKGLMRKSTQIEVEIGEDNDSAVVPLYLQQKLDALKTGTTVNIIPGSDDVSTIAINLSTITDSPENALLNVFQIGVGALSMTREVTLPLRHLYLDTTSGSINVDNNDGTDYRFSYDYTAPILTLTKTSGGNFKVIYITT
ncbi:hypothetical protein F9L16_23875 [Agarivorans sp. B2Z047]|uniref:hypothetical protein n=1 Tax=Agarivorans sp. B2Z047 TaxID=2652721 RepID=UPI00128D4A75|nr:hypothetical protein [Agarivorans sp. B2Z047]MPW31989.1 hypothetical protein [Agarivorans sp. B2Z047]UQN41861.1 hypothetical protein LQZ07_19095 [Agarivorans sp. B2Z047]